MSESTHRQEGLGRPVRALRVTVVTGPDTGRSISAAQSLTIGTAENNELVLEDPTVSRHHLELSREGEEILVVDLGSTNGVYVSGARLERARIAPGVTLRLGRTHLKVDDGGEAHLEVHRTGQLGELIGSSEGMRALMARVERAASGDGTVLILGETGTGKDVVARTIHALSSRRDMPFEVVDCGAVLPSLLASELFGHEKGAFTGAERRHVGAFERCAGGTLFLDEIGELPGTLQAALLGVLERRAFRRLGGEELLPMEARVLSATHRDLRAGVNDGSFRADLYYRIAVALLKVPALRDHPDDIPELIAHFARATTNPQTFEATFPASTIAELQRHRWPGNVRELRNAVEATIMMGEAPVLENAEATLPPGSSKLQSGFDSLFALPYTEAKEAVADQFENQYLRALLDECDGNIGQAATRAKIHRTYLTRLLKRRGIRLKRAAE